MTAVPLELQERPQWVIWRLEQRDGRTTKVPYSADGGGRASSTDPSSWTSFPAAVAAAEALAADGIGFVFTADYTRFVQRTTPHLSRRQRWPRGSTRTNPRTALVFAPALRCHVS